MRNQLVIITVLCVLAVAAWLLLFGPHPSTHISSPDRANKAVALLSATTPTIAKNSTTTSPTASQPAAATPASASVITPSKNSATLIPAALEFTKLPPETVLENMRLAFRNYLSAFGSNPVGTNPEITQALDGGNRKQTHFLNEDDGLRINGNGELIDPWGSPYFFHQLSGTEMEIHSAGPDRVLWTADDLVSK
jgi:hypothetical protein